MRGAQSVDLAFMQDLGLESWENYRWMLSLMEAPERWQRCGSPKRLAHCSAHDYLKHDLLPKEQFNSFDKFAVVLDAVDRAVSTWRYLGSKNFNRFVDNELEKMIKK